MCDFVVVYTVHAHIVSNLKNQPFFSVRRFWNGQLYMKLCLWHHSALLQNLELRFCSRRVYVLRIPISFRKPRFYAYALYNAFFFLVICSIHCSHFIINHFTLFQIVNYYYLMRELTSEIILI